jgi:hypothetical protein
MEIPKEIKKSCGIYYTPAYIVQYIIERTLGKLLEDKSPDQVSGLKIIDPSCGTGYFLISAYKYLIEWHRKWHIKHSSLPDDWQLPVQEKKRILCENIYGVDIDKLALEQTRLSLLTVFKIETGIDININLNLNIKNGNSLGENFNWKKEFPEVFYVKVAGFDLVVGNPPFGAKVDFEAKNYLTKRFMTGTTDTAALMTLLARELTKVQGMVGFVVPKSMVYSSNWKKVREKLLDELVELVDVGKAWKDVKLEQVIFFQQKGVKTDRYSVLKRDRHDFNTLGTASKEDCRSLGFILNGICGSEIELSRKVVSSCQPLGSLITNIRGAMLQRAISNKKIGKRVIGGKQIKRFHIKGEKGFTSQFSSNAEVRPGNILVQNIIAHIANPNPHIKITGLVADEELSREIVILDTVNQFRNNSNLSSNYILGLLHSRLINWYVYNFIFARAIRTMHFDRPVTDRIPIKMIDFTIKEEKRCYELIVEHVERLSILYNMSIKEEVEIEKLFNSIDQTVFELYRISDKDQIMIN